MTKRIEITTDRYIASHGHAPRANAAGRYAFEINGETIWTSYQPNYRAACKEASRIAADMKAAEIKLLP